MMFFVYAVITLTVVLLAIINVQPFKKSAVRYPSNDPIFFILLSLTFITIIGIDVTSRENIFFNYSTMTMLIFSVIVPIIYITFFITLWLARRVKWIHQLIDKRRTHSLLFHPILFCRITNNLIYFFSSHAKRSSNFDNKNHFYKNVTVHEKTMHNALDINLRYRPI